MAENKINISIELSEMSLRIGNTITNDTICFNDQQNQS